LELKSVHRYKNAVAVDVVPSISKGSIAIKLRTVASGLAAPDYAISPPGDTTRLFVLEQKGQILIVQNGPLLSTPALKDHPRWYNAITTNCTTSIQAQHSSQERSQWDWRILANGSLDESCFMKIRVEPFFCEPAGRTIRSLPRLQMLARG
jgi:hypothetical protein